MAQTYQVDDTAPVCAVGAYCSGRALTAGTSVIVEAEVGGAGTATASSPGLNAGETDVVALNIECPVPAGSSWDAGTWTVKLNVTVANGNLTLEEVHICRVSSGCVSQASIGSATGLALSLGSTGVVSANVTGSAQTPSTGDKVVVTLVFTNSKAHGGAETFSFDHSAGNSEVLSPFASAPPASGSGSGSLRASARETVSQAARAAATLRSTVAPSAARQRGTGSASLRSTATSTVSQAGTGRGSLTAKPVATASQKQEARASLRASGIPSTVLQSGGGSGRLSAKATARALVQAVSVLNQLAASVHASAAQSGRAEASLRSAVSALVARQAASGSGRLTLTPSVRSSQAAGGSGTLSASVSARVVAAAVGHGGGSLKISPEAIVSQAGTGSGTLHASAQAVVSQSSTALASLRISPTLTVSQVAVLHDSLRASAVLTVARQAVSTGGSLHAAATGRVIHGSTTGYGSGRLRAGVTARTRRPDPGHGHHGGGQSWGGATRAAHAAHQAGVAAAAAVAGAEYDQSSGRIIFTDAYLRAVAVSQEQVEDVYSRIPVLRPPPNVFVLRNAEIGAERLFEITHSLNVASRQMSQERLRILGMHEMGTNFVTIAGDAGTETVVHEAVHGMGVRNEIATRAITRGLMARASMNMGFRRRQVSYRPVPVDMAQRDSFLASMHLSNPSGGDVELVHLVYTPG